MPNAQRSIRRRTGYITAKRVRIQLLTVSFFIVLILTSSLIFDYLSHILFLSYCHCSSLLSSPFTHFFFYFSFCSFLPLCFSFTLSFFPHFISFLLQSLSPHLVFYSLYLLPLTFAIYFALIPFRLLRFSVSSLCPSYVHCLRLPSFLYHFFSLASSFFVPSFVFIRVCSFREL